MPASETARRDRIKAALDAGSSETERVTFRGSLHLLPVITIALTDTVLNARSHRIRAQLEGVASAEGVKNDPEGEQAQETIRTLLRETPGFAPLKENLAAENQKSPGVITATGLLINANTRAVALRDLGKTHIDLAVLPADATIDELYALEADLQVAVDYKQDYSFTNELLFVHDLITDQQRSEGQVALQMRWATPGKAASITKGTDQVRRYTRHLAFIREIQALSGKKVPLVDFDDTQQTLAEFDTRYESLRVKDPDGADEMKLAQVLALLADLGYQASREIKPGWVDDYLADAIAENPVLKDVLDAVADGTPHAAAESELGGLDVLEDLDGGEDGAATTTAAQQTVATLVERLGKSAQQETVALPGADGEEKELPRETVLDAVQDALKAAAETAKEAAAQGDALKAATLHCLEAAKRLKKAATAWADNSSDPDFDDEAFTAALEKADHALAALKQQSATT